MRRLVAWFRFHCVMARWGWQCGSGDYSRREETYAELDRLMEIRRGKR